MTDSPLTDLPAGSVFASTYGFPNERGSWGDVRAAWMKPRIRSGYLYARRALDARRDVDPAGPGGFDRLGHIVAVKPA
jgi:hypothetical protein